jgi:hypothetical protein
MQPELVDRNGTVKMASTFVLLLGIYLFISPWIYGAGGSGNAWNNWIVGALMVIFSGIRLGGPVSMAWPSWWNCLLGAWVFCSPWIYGYTGNTARFANSLAIGVVVFLLALVSATAFHRATFGQPPMTPHRM